MYKELKIRFKKENRKYKYQDKMYLLRKKFKGELDSDIIIKGLEALEKELRQLNCEVGE